jgi:pantoate--beta-alanine ligase
MTKKMIVSEKISDFKEKKSKLCLVEKKVGFVPTMGALHEGHLSLINRANQECDFVVVSIFVNPTQFNNQEDFRNYPIRVEKDIELLKRSTCDLLFLPSKEEIYSLDYVFPEYDLGNIGEVMEGIFRPGHFKGVAQVVYRLFSIIEPNYAYFGLKDFQQVAVIKDLVRHFSIPINVIACETLREKSGLAMSSRNLNLSEQQKVESLIIYNTLLYAENLAKTRTPKEVKEESIRFFKKGNLELEYFEIVDATTLKTLSDSWAENSIACIVAYSGKVRLIDNMMLKTQGKF